MVEQVDGGLEGMVKQEGQVVSGGAGGSTPSGTTGVGGSITQPSFTSSVITINT